jgi:cystathionine beta-lyase
MHFSQLDDEQICLGADEDIDANLGGVLPPIVQTSLFRFKSYDDFLAARKNQHLNNLYTLGQNPTVEVLEKKLAALERGEACKCFGSGMGAVSGVLMGLLKKGDHVIYVNNIYGPTMELARHLRNFGIEFDIILDNDIKSIKKKIRLKTKLVFFESPGTMLFHMLDISQLVKLCKKRGVLTCIDNSWATPLYQKPLTMGVDIVLQSTTKYIGGHSDVIAGAIITNKNLLRKIFYNSYLLLGGALSPFDAWLLIRGLRTLPVRLKQHHSDALKIAQYLNEHPKVKTVYHPAVNPDDKELAEKQLTGYTGLFGFELKSGSFKKAKQFIDGLKIFNIGVSWGGVESLVLTPNTGNNSDSLKKENIPPGLIRFSVGLEGEERLIKDIDQALTSI